MTIKRLLKNPSSQRSSPTVKLTVVVGVLVDVDDYVYLHDDEVYYRQGPAGGRNRLAD